MCRVYLSRFYDRSLSACRFAAHIPLARVLTVTSNLCYITATISIISIVLISSSAFQAHSMCARTLLGECNRLGSVDRIEAKQKM